MTLHTLFPTRAIALLMTIGFVDLAVTAVLHAQGSIVELNPLMRFFIERSEWLFALVKASTLIAAWIAMVRYAPVNLQFVRTACYCASMVYLFVWMTWFFGSILLA